MDVQEASLSPLQPPPPANYCCYFATPQTRLQLYPIEYTVHSIISAVLKPGPLFYDSHKYTPSDKTDAVRTFMTLISFRIFYSRLLCNTVWTFLEICCDSFIIPYFQPPTFPRKNLLRRLYFIRGFFFLQHRSTFTT